MSVSTRTAQQPLGISQLGTALVVVALAIVIAAAIAFGSMATKKATVTPAAGLTPGAALDHGSRGEFNSVAVPGDVTENWGSYVIDGRPVNLGKGVVGNDYRHGGSTRNDVRHGGRLHQ